MQIEHITLGGNTAIRGSEGIYPETIELLKEFQIKSGTKLLPFPKTSFLIKLTITEEGSMFDIRKGKDIALMNVCCFEEKYSNKLLNLIRNMPLTKLFGEPRLPVMSQWLYTILVNPLILTVEEQQIAGEIELYIYYSLYLAKTKSN